MQKTVESSPTVRSDKEQRLTQTVSLSSHHRKMLRTTTEEGLKTALMEAVSEHDRSATITIYRPSNLTDNLERKLSVPPTEQRSSCAFTGRLKKRASSMMSQLSHNTNCSVDQNNGTLNACSPSYVSTASLKKSSALHERFPNLSIATVQSNKKCVADLLRSFTVSENSSEEQSRYNVQLPTRFFPAILKKNDFKKSHCRRGTSTRFPIIIPTTSSSDDDSDDEGNDDSGPDGVER